MASKDELSEQLTLSTKLAAVIERMAATQDRIEKSYATQVTAVEKLAATMNQVDTQQSVKSIESLHKAMGQVKKQSEQTGTTFGKKLTPAIGGIAGAIDGLIQGFENVIGLGKGMFGFFGGLISWLGNVAAAIIAIPFKLLTGLIDMAANAGGGMDELRREIEEVRKEFGKLTGPSAKAIFDTTATLKGFSDTGLSTWRIFGTIAERLKVVRELAVAMGASFNELRKEFIENGGAILAYQKGLGLSNEMMKTMGDYAMSMGRPLTKVLHDLTKQSLELGDAFEIDAKMISKDMAKAMTDVKHFAGATVKEIAQASVYARKLGIELEKITGILDAFETFDSAAENAAKLSQSFGFTVDAFKMMEAQSPAEQIQMLRDQFGAAGKDASTFNRQQMKLLATSTGLTEETARQAFSMKNQGMSLDAIKKKSEAAEKKTMTQAEAMKKLADAIERLVMSGGSQMGGFFDMFMKGFFEGVQSSREFMGIIWNIKMALMQTYMAGVQLGRAFVKLFPGVHDFLGGLADFFQPEKFRKLTNGVVEIFKDFFKKLSTGKWSFGELMKDLRKKFFDFFSAEMPAGHRILDGFKKMLKTVSGIVAEGIKWIAEQLADVFKFIADVIQHPEKLSQAAAAGEGALGFLAEILKPIVMALKDAWTVLAPAVWDLLTVLGKKVYEFLSSDKFLNFVKPAIPYLAAALFGPMLGRAIIGAFTTTMATTVVSGISKWMTGKGKQLLPEATSSVEAVKSGQALQKGAGINWSTVMKVVAGIAMVMAIGMVAFLLAVAAIRVFKISTEEIVKSLLMLGGMAATMALIALPLALLSKIKIDPSSVLMGIGIMTLAILAMAASAALIYVTLKAIDVGKMRKILDAVMEITKLYAVSGIVVLEAMAIGALVSATGGTAGLAALAGFAIMASAVQAMAIHAIGIMKSLEGINFAIGLQEKVDMFVSVLNALTGFARVFADIFKALKPSFKFFQDEDPTEAQRNIDAATNFVKQMVGDASHGMIYLVNQVMNAIRFLGDAGDVAKRGTEMFATMMHASAALLTGMQPPKELMEDHSWLSIGTEDKVRSNIQGAADFTSRVSSSLTAVIDSVKKFITDIAGKNMTDADVKKMESLSGIFGLVVSVMNAMKVDDKTLSALKGGAGSGGLVNMGDALTLSKLGDVISAQGLALRGVLTSFAENLKPIVDAAANLPSANKLESAKIIMPLITSAFGVISSLSNVVSSTLTGKMPNGTEPLRAAHAMLDKLKGVLPAMMTSLVDSVQPMADKLMNVKLVGDPKIIGSNIALLKSTLEAITVLPQIVSSVTALSGIAGGEKAITDLLGIMTKANVAVGLLLMSGVQGSPSVVDMAETISKAKIVGVDAKRVETIKTMFDNIKSMSEGVPGLLTALGGAAKAIPEGGIAPAVMAVSDAVTQVQKLDDALAKLPTMNVVAKLANVAKAVGLGSKAVYTVKSKEVVINLNLNVSMDVGEVEKIMVMRKSSIIRDRLEFATIDHAGKPGYPGIPDTYSKAPVPDIHEKGT